jgi:hypothetical protein
MRMRIGNPFEGVIFQELPPIKYLFTIEAVLYVPENSV